MNQPRHILLIAFAYAPGKGSEPGVGWNMAHALAEFYKVTVVTRPGEELPPDSVNVIRVHPEFWPDRMVPSPGSAAWQLYYYAWTRELGTQLPRILDRTGADVVQHSTYVRYWMPSAQDTAGRPFVWGPVGGGEGMPRRFTQSLSPATQRSERFRELIRASWERDPAVRRTAAAASIPLATTTETAQRMRSLTDRPIPICPIVGLAESEFQALEKLKSRPGRGFQLLTIGRMIDWKGYDLVVEALKNADPSVELTMVGDGSERHRLEQLATARGVQDRIRFLGWMERADVLRQLEAADALVHPSYHDSGGMVCLEAMAAGKPVVTLEGNGPALLTGEAGLPVAAPTREAAVRGLGSAIQRLAEDRPLRQHLGESGRQRVRNHFLWQHRAEAVSRHIETALGSDGEGE